MNGSSIRTGGDNATMGSRSTYDPSRQAIGGHKAMGANFTEFFPDAGNTVERTKAGYRGSDWWCCL